MCLLYFCHDCVMFVHSYRAWNCTAPTQIKSFWIIHKQFPHERIQINQRFTLIQQVPGWFYPLHVISFNFASKYLISLIFCWVKLLIRLFKIYFRALLKSLFFKSTESIVKAEYSTFLLLMVFFFTIPHPRLWEKHYSWPLPSYSTVQHTSSAAGPHSTQITSTWIYTF